MSVEHGTESERKKLCQEIDQIVLEVFSTMAELYQEQNRLHQAMKSGFINLSRARYSMGMRNVGVQQYDESNMKATVKVILDDDRLSKFDTNNMDEASENDDVNDQGPISGLRHRKVASKTEDGFEVIEKVEDLTLDDRGDSSSNLEASNKAYDPLKWFGILVPPALRQCQKDFRSTTDTVLCVANLKRRLETLQDQYATLMKQKKSMQESR